jgi:hypothetical protein
MEARLSNTDDCEPVISRERKATENKNSVRVNLTKAGADIVGVDAGEMLEVRVFDDHFEIYPTEG